MRRTYRLAIVTIAALALWAVPARAQVPVPSVKFEFTPWAGAYVPATDLIEEGVAGPAPVSIQSGIAFGGNLAVRMPMGIAIEGQVGYAPAEIEFDDGSGPQTEDLKVLFAGANAQFRFGPPLIPVKPYVTGGLGLVRWDSDAFADPVTNIAGNLGGGAYIALGPVMKLRLDGRAYLTTANAQDFGATADESKFQSHFVASGGLVFEFGM